VSPRSGPLGLHNTSPYRSEEIARLARETSLALRATKHFIEVHDVALHVKGSRTIWWAGMAYDGVPAMARNIPHGAKYLVTVRLNRDPNVYPIWHWGYGERYAGKGVLDLGATLPPALTSRICATWPLLEYHNWQMAFVATYAHEARHIQQYRYRRPASEVECTWASWYAIKGVFGTDAVRFDTDPHEGIKKLKRPSRALAPHGRSR
jgi:hypothetical protein